MTSSRGQDLYRKAKQIIPGGTQLLSKRPEMMLPGQWPSYFESARGAEVWDLDGNRYLDMSHNSVGACILGVADPDVDAAVVDAIRHGTMSTLNCPEEVELAELLCALHPWADMVRYARSGGEALAVAVRIARSFTGRSKVAVCGYHGWHDWYLAANLTATETLDQHLLPGLDPHGVPRELSGTTLAFRYNCIDAFEAVTRRHADELAAIVMEPVRGRMPEDGFLQRVRAVATDIGAVLVMDEVTAGFRLTTGGAHKVLNVTPDIAVFGKALGNGYPMAAVIGRRAVMNSAQDSFISSTYWTERIGPVAALATIRKHIREDVVALLADHGERVQAGWRESARKAGLPLNIDGIPPLSHFSFDAGNDSRFRTVFTQLMLDRGFLATSSFYPTFAHTNGHISDYLRAVEEVFILISDAEHENRIDDMMQGPCVHKGFRRLN